MIINNALTGEKVSLRTCDKQYATKEYVDWLNDPQINQFLETRHEEQTLEKIVDYICKVRDSENEILFAMIEHSQGRHIGNIHLTFNRIHKRCFFGYFIGNKEFWGQEIAVEAIQLATKWAFETTDIVRMDGGTYSRNVFSLKTMIKAGYHKEAVLKDYFVWKRDLRDDNVLVCQSREEFMLFEPKHKE